MVCGVYCSTMIIFTKNGIACLNLLFFLGMFESLLYLEKVVVV